LKWRFSAEDRISGLSLFRPKQQDNILIIVSSHDSNLYGLDLAGKQQWKLGTDDYINAAAAVSGTHVLIGGCDGHLRIVNAKDGRQVAAVDLEAPIPGSIIVADGDAYAATLSGRLCRIRIPEGKIVWSYQDDKEEFMSSPAVGEKFVSVGGSMGTLISVDRKTGKIPPFPVGPINADDTIECPIVPRGKDVVFGSNDGRIYLVDPAARTLKWSYRIGREIIAGPTVVGSKIIVGSTDGSVYCFNRE
jgi:outer membrane protein assembly factor BamB